jgi:antitoxin (DNA-binding transcriptional repressor) of toxin-antitoxin stability system
MAVIGVRELARETRRVLDQLEENGEPVVVARHGKPVAVLAVPTSEQLADADLAATPGFRESLDDANRELAEGKTRPFDEVLDEVEAEEGWAEAEVGVEGTAHVQKVLVADDDFDAWLQSRVPPENVEEARELNANLIDGMVEASLGRVVFEVKSINEELASIADGPQGLSGEEYLSLLKATVALKKAQKRLRFGRNVPVRTYVVEDTPEEVN